MNARATHTRHCLPPAVAASPVARVSVSQMTRPNGITTTWSYETNRDLITQVQNGTVSTYGYVNDAIGRRTAMSRSGSAYPTSDVISYTYNDRSELTGAQSNVVSTYSYSYAYDPIGNRVTASEAGVPWTYTANNLNQYTSATENNVQLNFAYDLDGGMTYRPVDATSGWTQVWNGENRMVETYKGADRLTFKYDYMGRRVEKCVYSGNVLVSKTLFVYDGFKCVEELDGLDNNAALKRHTWQPFEAGLDVVLATADSGGTSYFLHDVNKNVMQKTAANGALQETYAYAPFGGNAGTDRAHVGFSSEIAENDMGMVYYNYRYLMPLQGRWLKRDSFLEDNNLHLFVENSPIMQYDTLGLFGDGKKAKEEYLKTHMKCIAYITTPNGHVICTKERPYTEDEKRRIVDNTPLGHSDFLGGDEFDFTWPDNAFWTDPLTPWGIWKHFQDRNFFLNKIKLAITTCNKRDFSGYMHYYQDSYVHYDNHYRAWPFHGAALTHWLPGHASANIVFIITHRRYGEDPDDTRHQKGKIMPSKSELGWYRAYFSTALYVGQWMKNCCRVCEKDDIDGWMPKTSGKCLQ